jgi:hypothetical protein
MVVLFGRPGKPVQATPGMIVQLFIPAEMSARADGWAGALPGDWEKRAAARTGEDATLARAGSSRSASQ